MSEYMENEFEYEIRVERLNIIIYSLYSILIMYVASRQDWGVLVFMLFLADLAVCWSLYLTKSMTFRLRATVTTIGMLAGVYVFSVFSGELVNMLAIVIAVVILVGLYEIPELIILCAAVTGLLIIHHGLILRDLPFTEDASTNVRVALRLLAMFVAEYAAYYLVYNQKQARRRQAMIIGELKDAEQSRDDFLANVSHELRTPINTINGMSEMLLRDHLTDQVRQEVFNVQAASKNLLSIVSDILDYSELQGGQMEIEEEEYHIASTINDVISMTMARKEEKNIEFIVDCDATLPRVIKGDEQKVRRVIMNLINNAVKYTQNGCVTFEIGYRREGYGINLIVGVRDTGIGMTKADIEKLFNGFGQIDTKRNRKDSGIGLGLAISSAIVDAMGGFITVESEYGTGTYIQFSIPQQIIEEEPVVEVFNKDKIRVCTYFNMEQFDIQMIRDAYGKNMERFAGQLGIETVKCRNLREFKRRVDNAAFTHVFISLSEYKEDRDYFDQLAEKVRVIVAIERWQDQELRSGKLRRLYKPFYVLPVAVFLNNSEDQELMLRSKYHHERFIAPDAKILIVDDNLLNIKVAEGLLKPYMIQTSHALSGKEALAMIRQETYDFIFMDHMMPEMDGIECLDHIRQISGAYYKQVPVIALTANAIGGTREMFLEKGFADFVAKPIELSVLERVLRRNLPKDKLVMISENEAARLGQKLVNVKVPEKDTAPADEKGQTASRSAAAARGEEVVQSTEAAAGVVRKKAGQESGIREENSSVSGAGGTAAGEKDLVVGDLDIAQGETYCGGREAYIDILKIQSEDEVTLQKITDNYSNENWKDYVILVHGVKSTMKSIGAQPLSDMAKGLEFAGKAGDISYIHDNHQNFINEYSRIQGIVKGYFNKKESGQKEEESLPEISRDEFRDTLEEFETAMYAMDDQTMKAAMDHLNHFQFNGKILKKELKNIANKVDMADYFSAYDSLELVYKRLCGEKEGEQ